MIAIPAPKLWKCDVKIEMQLWQELVMALRVDIMLRSIELNASESNDTNEGQPPFIFKMSKSLINLVDFNDVQCYHEHLPFGPGTRTRYRASKLLQCKNGFLPRLAKCSAVSCGYHSYKPISGSLTFFLFSDRVCTCNDAGSPQSSTPHKPPHTASIGSCS